MAEYSDFRDNMEMLSAQYPNEYVFTVEEIQQIMKWKSIKTTRKHLAGYIGKSGRVTKVSFAKFLSEKPKAKRRVS